MLLTTTLNAELDKVDRERAAGQRLRFAALARSDFSEARRHVARDRELAARREELLAGGVENWFPKDEL